MGYHRKSGKIPLQLLALLLIILPLGILYALVSNTNPMESIKIALKGWSKEELETNVETNLELRTKKESEVINIQPHSAEYFNHQGKILREQGDYEKAILLLQKALKLNPNYTPAYNNLGLALLEQGKKQKAITSFKQAIKLNSLEAEGHKNLCLALQQEGKLLEAINSCELALILDPELKELKLFLQEAKRFLVWRKNKKIFLLPESLPSLEEEPDLNLKRSVVKIIIKSGKSLSVGTGWVVKREGSQVWIVTNRHVVTGDPPQKKKKIEVEFYSEPLPGQFRKRKLAKILHATESTAKLDLAVLTVTDIPEDIQPLPIAPNTTAKNTFIRILGNPITGDDWTVTRGIVSHKSAHFLQLSSKLAPGNSGGPVLDDRNQVVGVVVAKGFGCSQVEWGGIDWELDCGLAIPIDLVKAKLESWEIL